MGSLGEEIFSSSHPGFIDLSEAHTCLPFPPRTPWREALGRLLWPWLILTTLSLHGTQSISLQICIADSHDIFQIMAYWQSRDDWPILCPMIKSFPAQTTSSACLTRFPGWLKRKYPRWWTFFKKIISISKGWFEKHNYISRIISIQGRRIFHSSSMCLDLY